MIDVMDAQVEIYRVLDVALTRQAVPPGTKGAMYCIIEYLRSSKACGGELRRAENIAIDLHRLEAALQQRNCTEIDVARHSLRAHAAALIQTRISSRGGQLKADIAVLAD